MTAQDFLPPGIGGVKLISLLNMKEYLTSRLVCVSKNLAECYLICFSDPIPDTERAELATISSKKLLKELGIIDERFEDEIDRLNFYHVSPARQSYYNKTDLFWTQFKENFPTANAEIIEAGNCFAFDRFSASVFHLMRAMEIALRVLFVSIGMPSR